MTRVILDTLAALSIVDHHMRRKEGIVPDRVTGALMGATVGSDVQVRNIVQGFQNKFIESVLRSYANDSGVGWYSTQFLPTDMKDIHSPLLETIHRPVMIVVSFPTEQNPNASINFRAFVAVKVKMMTAAPGHSNLPYVWKEMDCVVQTIDAMQQVAVNQMVSLCFPELARASNAAFPPLAELKSNPFAELVQMKTNLDVIVKYCDDVIAGKAPAVTVAAGAPPSAGANVEIGRKLLSILATQRDAAMEVSKEVTEEKIQDQIMLMYISTLLSKQMKELQGYVQTLRPAPKAVAAAAVATAASDDVAVVPAA